MRGPRADAELPDANWFGIPVELSLELGAIVSLEDEDSEKEPLSNLVQESECGTLVAGIVVLRESDSSAIVDGSKLTKPFGHPRDALEERHIHLQAAAGLGLLVPFPPFTVRLVLLIGWSSVHPVLYNDPMHARAGDLHAVKALQVRCDSARPKVVVLSQIQALLITAAGLLRDDRCGVRGRSARPASPN